MIGQLKLERGMPRVSDWSFPMEDALLEWAQNYVLEESEWHQEEFDPLSRASLLKFTLHARLKRN